MQRESPPFGGLLTIEPGQLRRIYQSPGPIYDPEEDAHDPWRWAPALRAAGFQPGDVVLNAFGYHLTPAGAMFEEGLEVLGRVGESVKVRGMFLHPRQASEVLARFPEVTAWQAVITRVEHRDELAFRIATAAPSDELEAQRQDAIRDGLKFRAEVVFVRAADIPADARRIGDERRWD